MKWTVLKRQKLIHFLKSVIADEISAKKLKKALESNCCRVNGVVERFASKDLSPGSVVEFADDWKKSFTSSLLHFDLIFEDDSFIVVNKPSGWVCDEKDLSQFFETKLFLIHRLDKDTTGVLLAAKSHEIKEKMIELFERKNVTKTYLAIVDGVMTRVQGNINTKMSKIGFFEGQSLWGSSPNGVAATTYWELISSSKSSSLVACFPLTGRTHQLRVHLSELGHPILTDRQYAKGYRSKFFAKRPLLHAYSLKFCHPITQENLTLIASIPEDFVEACTALGLKDFNNCLKIDWNSRKDFYDLRY
jgi:RluA family pseudouridine synthase